MGKNGSMWDLVMLEGTGLGKLAHPQSTSFVRVSLFLCTVVFTTTIWSAYVPAFEGVYHKGFEYAFDLSQVGTLSASVMTLDHPGLSLAVSTFCSTAGSTCHHNECDTEEDNFCGQITATKVFMVINLVLLFVSMSYQTTIILNASGVWGSCGCGSQSWSVARHASWVNFVITFLSIVMVLVFGLAKGQAPDITSNGTWMYLPQIVSLHWKVAGPAIPISIVNVFLLLIASVCSLIGAAALKKPATSNPESGRAAFIPGSAPPQGATQIDIAQNAKYAEYNDTIL